MLEIHNCFNCGGQVKVARVVPCDEWIKVNGVWVSRMNEVFESTTVGVLCVNCAFTINELDLGFSGGKIDNLTLWDATITPKTPIRFSSYLLPSYWTSFKGD